MKGGRAYHSDARWRLRRRIVVVTGLVVVALFLFWLFAHGSSGW
jgi:hypothetical protein